MVAHLTAGRHACSETGGTAPYCVLDSCTIREPGWEVRPAAGSPTRDCRWHPGYQWHPAVAPGELSNLPDWLNDIHSGTGGNSVVTSCRPYWLLWPCIRYQVHRLLAWYNLRRSLRWANWSNSYTSATYHRPSSCDIPP